MNQQRYDKLIQYKSKLDNEYFSNPQAYKTTLSNAKLAGFKVFRNSKGIHKLEENDEGTGDIWEAFGGIFGDIFHN